MMQKRKMSFIFLFVFMCVFLPSPLVHSSVRGTSIPFISVQICWKHSPSSIWLESTLIDEEFWSPLSILPAFLRCSFSIHSVWPGITVNSATSHFPLHVKDDIFHYL